MQPALVRTFDLSRPELTPAGTFGVLWLNVVQLWNPKKRFDVVLDNGDRRSCIQ
jgi:hypothetical protein